VDSVDSAKVGRHPLGVGAALDQDLVREQRSLADPRVLERDQALLRIARLGDGVGVAGAELEIECGDGEGQDHRHAGACREPAPPRDRLGPAGPGSARLVVGAPVGPVEPWPELRQDHGKQGDRDHRRDQRDQHPAVAHRAQERKRQRDQGEQTDRHSDAAEDHRPAGGLHRLLHRLLVATAMRALLAPARDHQQRVVDRHPEPDQGDQELDDRRDLGDLGQAQQEQEAGHDRDDGDHQRDYREEGGEDEGEHDQSASAADNRLEQHARALAVRAAVLGQGVEAGQMYRRAADGCALERRACVLLGLRVLAELRVRVGRRVDEREGRPAVVGDECLIPGRRIRGDSGPGQRLVELGVHLLQVGLDSGRVDRLAGGQFRHRNQGCGVTGPAVLLIDRQVGLPALLLGH
jgi:hypothetical protein